MWNPHSWPWDATSRGSRSATSSANMSSNSRNVKSPFLITTCHYWGVRSASSSANMSSNSRNVKFAFFATRCIYCGRGRSASWSANMSYNSRNLKSPFLVTICLDWGVDLPVDLPIWGLTVEMWNPHSWSLHAITRGVDLASRSATSSASMSSNSRNVKLPFLTTRCHYLVVDLPPGVSEALSVSICEIADLLSLSP